MNFGLVPRRQDIVQHKMCSVLFEVIESLEALGYRRIIAILSAERRHYTDDQRQRYEQYTSVVINAIP